MTPNDASREGMFAKIFTLAPLYLAISSVNTGKLVEVNDTFLEVSGYTRKEALGKTPLELDIWVDNEAFHRGRQKLIEQGYINSQEVQFRSRAGKVRSYLLSAVITELEGEPVVVNAALDITDRKQAEADVRFHAFLLDNLYDAIIATDKEQQILVWNKGAERLFGYSKEEAIGQLTRDLITSNTTPETRAKALASLEELGVYDIENLVKDKEGQSHYTEGRLVRVDVPGHSSVNVSVTRDISKRKETEFALASLNQELETKVSERTAQVQELAKQLSYAEQLERENLASTLHDGLQQELYGVRFAVSSLKRNLEKPEDLVLINEIERLLVSSIQSTRNITKDLSPTTLDKTDLCESLNWLAQEMEERYGLEVKITGINSCDIPSKFIRTTVYNLSRELLFNIVKHAEVTKAELDITLTDQHLKIKVSDKGKGFNAHAQTPDATGLGLSGAHKRLSLFGGSLAIQSQPGQGTEITIHLPKAAFTVI